ncbi:aromatic prenyltransferase [Streptomyces sp. NBC_00365]|uniref:aromatic prenyltransferase n=1 Tax=Streptomyces sp. NBC_00365 TaxID=2975726 RepID=UPI002257ECF9|nr:aromatic prenyltransferase [Streptomyces sp. NBC_00365]MCX5096740.1 aromatic prenyltransferase [Streptomyces sp. NBC_00365]
MSNKRELAGLYSVIEESARLVDVTCSRETVWPILTAYGDVLAEAVVAFRVATGERNDGDFDCRFTLLPKDMDPYAVALESGLSAKTDHPVGSLLGELHREFPIASSGIDFGVVGGFKKTWSFFPTDDLQSLSDLVRLESLPPSVAGNLDFFTRYQLADRVSLVGIDYPNRSVNLYFGAAPEHTFQADGIRSILRDAGLAAPSERLLRLGEQAFGIYATLTWDSPNVERITIAAMTPDPTTLPVRIEPKIEHYVNEAPYSTDDRQFVYAITSSPKGEYHKLQSYYKWQSRVENILLVSDNG